MQQIPTIWWMWTDKWCNSLALLKWMDSLTSPETNTKARFQFRWALSNRSFTEIIRIISFIQWFTVTFLLTGCCGRHGCRLGPRATCSADGCHVGTFISGSHRSIDGPTGGRFGTRKPHYFSTAKSTQSRIFNIISFSITMFHIKSSNKFSYNDRSPLNEWFKSGTFR